MAANGHARAIAQGARLSLAILRLGLMVSAAFGVVRLASAEIDFNRDTVPAVREAAKIGSSDYWRHLAELDPAHATHALKEGALADPRNASLWIALALEEERLAEQGIAEQNRNARLHDFSAARAAFEKAFASDRQYAPAWALANFCFRHQHQEPGYDECFWRAAARAALRSPSLADLAIADSGGSAPGTSANLTVNLTDLAPLLGLAGRMEASPVAALDRLAVSVNRFAEADGATSSYARSLGNELEKAWLNDLIGQERWENAAAMAERIEARHDAADKARLDDFVDRLIAAGQASEAVETWNRYTDFAPVAPAKGILITNGDFFHRPTDTGFDWRMGLHRSGLDAHWIEKRWEPKLMEIRLSGEQPEQIELAEQWLPVAPRTYRLRFEYSTRGLAAPSGIRWEFASEEKGGDRHADSEPLAPSGEWRTGRWTFTNESARPLSLARLRLIYIREPGSGRARGLLSLRRVSLETL